MAIVISDERVIERLNQLANQLNQTPEQIIADAIDQFSPATEANGNAFWKAIHNIGDSGDPMLAYHIKDILRDEVDPVEGWSKPHGAEDPDRQ